MALALALASCGEPSPLPEQEGSGSADASATDDAVGSDSTLGPGSASQTGSGASVASVDSSGGSDTNDTEPGVVRFAAFGDQGEGNDAQFMVASAAEVVCAERGCDFSLLLGDNFYTEGVTSAMDQQFIDKFEAPYEGLDMPFYVVLGNHDYGLLANDWDRGNYQVEYTNYSAKWVLPYFWYTFSPGSGDTQFFMFDTARMMWNHDVDDQRQWLASELLASPATWKIAVGHHPYISNGKHGNAGNFDGLGWLPFSSGEQVKDVIEDLVCGQAHVYISGHDHNRQVFDPVCGTYFLVAGAASKTEDFVFREDNPTAWGDDTREGFLWVQIADEELTAAFYDLDGNLDHELVVGL